jgi:prepilin-type N-terminal cleavage/methylation domain-containing protein
MRVLLRRTAGFTLIELLVVILIIGILIAVSAPSFLGQTQKAHDSEAKQYLTVAYKAAKASATDRDGQFVTTGFDTTALAAAIHDSEPALTVAPVLSGTCSAAADGNPKHIFVGPGTVADSLEICNDPTHTVWTLTVTHNGPPIITSEANVALGGGSGDGGVDSGGGGNCAASDGSGMALATPAVQFAANICGIQIPKNEHVIFSSHPLSSAPTLSGGWVYLGTNYFNINAPDFNGSPIAGNGEQLLFSLYDDALPAGVDASQVFILHNGHPEGPPAGGAAGATTCIDAPHQCFYYVDFYPTTWSPTDTWAIGYKPCSGTTATGQAVQDLVWAKDDGTNTFQLMTMNADGSSPTQLADLCSSSGVFPSPSAMAASANGTVAFISAGNSTGIEHVWTLSASGTLTTLDHNLTQLGVVALSPNGSKVAYSGFSEPNINTLYVSSSSGGATTAMSIPAGDDPTSAWSTWAFVGNGQLIASISSGGTDNNDFYLLDASSGDILQHFTTTPPDGKSSLGVSADQTKLVYQIPGSVHVLDLTAGTDTDVSLPESTDSYYDADPRWSPDGSKISFVSTRRLPPANPGDLWLMNADGTGKTELTNESTGSMGDVAYVNNYSWAPDGASIVFASQRDATANDNSTFDLYKVTVSTQAVTRLTNDSLGDFVPTFRTP